VDIFEDIGNAAFHFSGMTAENIAQGIPEFLRELSEGSEKARYIESEAQRWREAHAYGSTAKRLLNICYALARRHHPHTYRFHGSSPRLKTEVGIIKGKSIVGSGVAGNLIHGPYVSLPPGRYRVSISGTLGENGAGTAHADVAILRGKQTLAQSDLHPADKDGRILSLPVSLDSTCTDLEVRVWVREHSDVSISTIEIRPL
jgi:hypothetical protein